MKRSSRLNPWGRFLGLAIFGLLIAGSGQHSTQAAVISPAQAFPAIPPSGLINQNDGYDWSGNWTAYIVLPSGYIAERTLTITGGSGSAYTATTYLCEIEYYPTDVDVDDTGTQSFWVEGYAFRIHMETFYNGIQAVTCDAFLNRTTHPDQLAGKLVEIYTHEVLLNDWPPPVVPLSSPEVYENPLCAARNGAGMPEPCGAEPTNGLIPVIGGSVPAPPSAPTSAPPPEAQNPQPEAPPIQEAGPPSSGEESFPPPVNSDETSIPIDWNMVSPAGQAAAAAATTALLAAWLFMESRGTTQGSSSNDLVDTILRETNYYGPAEAGHYLAANTADILDHLNKPPAATSAPQPSASSPPANNQPDTSYFGPPGHPAVEVFDGRDAYNILHALQLIPQDVPPDGQFQFNRSDLDRFLNGHPDGVPHEVRLPNGNVVVVGQVQGITFEDRGGDDSDHSTVDFTRGIAIAVNVIKPDVSLSAEDLAAAALEQASQQGNAQPPGQGPASQASQSGLPDRRPGEQPGDEGSPDEPPRGESPEQQDETTESGDHPGQGPMDEGEAGEPSHGELIEETQEELQSAGGPSGQRTGGEGTPDELPGSRGSGESSFEGQGTGEAAGTDTPDGMPSETDRSFGDTGRSDSQGQVPGERIPEGAGSRSSIGGPGSRDFYDGIGNGEEFPEPGDAEDRATMELMAELEADAEPMSEDDIRWEEMREEVTDKLMDPTTSLEEQESLEDQLNLFDRVDNLIDELASNRAGIEDGLRPPSNPLGGDEGSSQAGIIDGDETESATGDL